MQTPALLLIGPGAPALAAHLDSALARFAPECAPSLEAAAARLAEGGACVGLLVEPCQFAPLPAWQSFLQQHWQACWLGLLPRATLDQAGWRRLVSEHLWDFHTSPADPARLAQALGHAHGWLSLHAPAPAPPAAAGLLGDSAAMRTLRAAIGKVAAADAPVLIRGESGAGKELAAAAIHAASRRAGGPFVAVNCGAIAPGLIQSELFGHVRGAFTGAQRDKPGLIELAEGGTLFLDEIGEMPRELQANLLRFLQEGTVQRVGATRSQRVDVRVLAATHVDLDEAARQGSFRADLLFRLHVLGLAVPPLRARQDDVLLLAEAIFARHADERPARLRGFGEAARAALLGHDWPGNVRELINRVRRAMVMADGRWISPHDLGLAAPAPAALAPTRARAEAEAVRQCLAEAGGNISQAARLLGVSRMTLYRLLARHGIAH
ncbi:sigma-54 dependent transcriptional regulator [Massilia sp. TS11]|uniref:sigma-54 dependent transcriptional regulator n=1 Tax=Massilia sp. TS11 TaxID=2908003 RepID=UPI001EDAB62C|nr:sigma-54 dependent transcriptional regulator [Massilia sp. TS11]MCG2585738.1 sigma-54 dependent transcriptional regulator [Massilia sp. TS11]